MKTIELRIEGMSCHHCIMSVRKELGKLLGVVVEDVKIGSARLQYDESRVTLDQLHCAVDEAGYRVVG